MDGMYDYSYGNDPKAAPLYKMILHLRKEHRLKQLIDLTYLVGMDGVALFIVEATFLDELIEHIREYKVPNSGILVTGHRGSIPVSQSGKPPDIAAICIHCREPVEGEQGYSCMGCGGICHKDCSCHQRSQGHD